MTKKEKNIIMSHFFAVQELYRITRNSDDPETLERSKGYFAEYIRLEVLAYNLGINDTDYSRDERKKLIEEYYKDR